MRRCVPHAVAALAALTGACAVPTAGGQANLALAFERLAWLDPAFGHYEAFAVAGGKPYSLGSFNVSPMGPLVALDGSPKASWTAPVPASAIDEVLVTQEAPDDKDPAPSRQVFLRGAVSGGKATLAPPVPADRFATAAGSYILDDPATEKDLDDFNGIWFSKIEDKRYMPGLDVQPAPAGTMYAAWLVQGRVALRIGKFSYNRENDDFYGYSGLDSVSLPVNFNGPPMPGEDFVKNLPPGAGGDLSGAQVIVSLESATLAGEDAFAGPLHVLEGWVPTPAAPRTSYQLENVAATRFPAGTAVSQ